MRQRRALFFSSVIFGILVYVVAWSPLLTVRSVEYTGIPKNVKASLVTSSVSITEGQKLSRIEPRAVEKKLSSFPWIDSVHVSRNWLTGKVAIGITSKVAVGIFRGQGIDAEGTLFTFSGSAPRGLPEIVASSTENGLAAINLFKSLPEDLQESLTGMSASNSSHIASSHLIKKHRMTITWGNSKDLALKVKVLRALLELPENSKITKVDLSAPHAPIVK